ncbi:MAG: FGGY-family carbohydrate kinase [Armatimonadota bacterium]
MAQQTNPYVLGIDCGTQSLRSALYDLKGNMIASDSTPFPIEYPEVSWAEQNPEHWWQAVRVTVPTVLREAGVHPRQVKGVSIDGTACTVVCCKRDGTLIRPALLWMDQRAHEEAAEVTATDAPVLKYAGGPESPEWMIPKAMWLKRNEPETYERAEVICEGTDWLMYRLTGRWTASLNAATCKWNYANPEGGWPESLLETLEMTELLDRWPRDVLPMGEQAGGISMRVSEEIGLVPDTPVAEGGIDAYAGMFGLNVVHPGRMALVMGSSTCHMALCSEARFDSNVWGPFPDAILKDTWVLEGGQTATGSIVKWFADNFAAREMLEAKNQGRSRYELLDELAAQVEPGAEGLVLLDYWQGNRTPLRDPLARGVIWGLSLRHELGHVMRAIYEGTAMGTRHILEDLRATGFRPKGMYAAGGGTRSQLWMQIHADVCQVPIYLTDEPEATALGTAVCAAYGAGLFDSLEEASDQMVRVTREIEPNDLWADTYDELFERYVATYPRLKDLMHEAAESAEKD